MPTFEETQMTQLEKYLQEKMALSAHRGMKSAALFGIQTIITKLIPQAKPHPPVDKGLYRAAWRVQDNGVDKPVEIVNNAPHALFIEYGVRASNVKIGRKMISALAEWSKRHQKSTSKSKVSDTRDGSSEIKKGPKSEKSKGVKFQKDLEKLVKRLSSFIKKLRFGSASVKNDKGKPTIPPMSDRQALNAAWAIATVMTKRGIFAPNGLRIAEKAEKILVKIVEREVARAISMDMGR
jgi:hypothetical protein